MDMEIDDFNIPVVDLTSEEEQKMDDDLDYALAYCLQTEFKEDSIPYNFSSREEVLEFKDVSVLDKTSSEQAWDVKKEKLLKANKEQDADYMLALQLQTEYPEENGMDCSLHSISSGKPKPLNQNAEKFKANKEQDADYMLALQLQKELAGENRMNSNPHSISNGKPKFPNQNVHCVKQKGGKLPSSIVDPEWEVLDPIPDVHSLFLQFNTEYFWGRLEGVEVRWSPRMTLCAGVCCYEGRGGLCSVRLSQPLLKYRPRRDLVETLLHEMIHAYLFVTHNNKDHAAHGPEFLKHMRRINQQTGTRISVYHSFHDEVDLHRKHWWKCNGPCQHRSPFFGLVKRAMNRAPAPRDPWWAQHQATCGGTFIKIKQPETSVPRKNLKRKNEVTDSKPGHGDIRNFFTGNSPASKENQSHHHAAISVRQPGVSNIHTVSSPDIRTVQHGRDIVSVVPFSGKGYTLGSSASESKTIDSHFRNGPNFLLKSVENKVTKVPSVGNSISSKRKETKNSQNPVQWKSPVHNESKNKHPGSSNTLPSNTKGTAVKFSSAGGSRTIVIPKNTKTSQMTKVVENSSNMPEMLFKGESHILGSGSKTSKEKKSKFPGSTILPSTSDIKEPNSGDSFDNSFDDVFPKTPNNRDNTKPEKMEPSFMEKETSLSQSRINFRPVSPDQKNCDNIKTESGSVINSNASVCVKCPVCGSVIRDFTINAHLDTCLKIFS